MPNHIIKFQGKVIEAVTIDFWNTIATDDSFISRVEGRVNKALEWFASHGYRVDYKTMRKLFDDFSEEWRHNWIYVQHTPGVLDLVAYLSNALKIKLKPNELKELADDIERMILEMPPKQVDGAVNAIKQLHKHLPVALLCDTAVSGPSMINELLRQWGIFKQIDEKVYSQDVGVTKPNSVIFRTALEALGDIKAERAIHFGDLEETDIKGAKDFGMFAVRFDANKEEEERNKETRAELVVESWNEFLNALAIKN